MRIKKKLGRIFKHIVDLISIILHPFYTRLGQNRLRVLLYHSIYDTPPGQDMSFGVISPDSFAQQMAFLAENGFNVISLDELIEYKETKEKLPARSIAITFDDGYLDNYINAFPILQTYNFNATFFVVTGYIDSPLVFDWPKINQVPAALSEDGVAFCRSLSKQNILDMSCRGAGFGSHTDTHCSLSDVSEVRAAEEISRSKDNLEEILSRTARCFSYPFNRSNGILKKIVRAAGYKMAFCGAGSNTLSSDFLELKRIEVEPEDSISTFGRRVEGAYDWYYFLITKFKFIRMTLKHGGRISD